MVNPWGGTHKARRLQMIEEAKELAKRFLDEKTYLHSQRVAAFTRRKSHDSPRH